MGSVSAVASLGRRRRRRSRSFFLQFQEKIKKMPEILRSQSKVERKVSSGKVERWSGGRKIEVAETPTDPGVLQLNVVLDDQKASRPRAAVAKNRSTVRLCCMTLTAGPGTSFGDFQVPGEAKCPTCGSEIEK